MAITIKDMDELTTKEEVAEAIVKELGSEIEVGQIGEFRSCYGGNRAVTVHIPSDKAARLLETGRIKIGLNQCLIMERVSVQQCFCCWGYGHIRSNCKGEDLSSSYKKCREVGHTAQNCEGLPRCLNCKVEGHAAGSGMCPEFRKALAKMRMKERENRGQNSQPPRDR
ncbi:hypothetical protein NQ314_011237 [Rhamnusium bicolor]|uniref:CCHC-type domain-containing protein n=1 Tax=Rhamnusium bicolor TaxID=1586634 RepID=A0AAV8XJI4_9CUCU|nr:hypothetical protein NQ314_011237 [Rhamnusium bicolor]